jgi:hypothetical protein
MPAISPVRFVDFSQELTLDATAIEGLALLPLMAHSQTVRTRHPFSRRRFRFFSSLDRLALNLSIQNRRRLFGMVER